RAPGGGFTPVGVRLTMIAGKDLPPRLGVTFRDSVEVAAQTERDLSHVQALLAAMTLQLGEVNVSSQRLLDQCIGKSVNARLNWRVSCEHAAVPHPCVIIK